MNKGSYLGFFLLSKTQNFDQVKRETRPILCFSVFVLRNSVNKINFKAATVTCNLYHFLSISPQNLKSIISNTDDLTGCLKYDKYYDDDYDNDCCGWDDKVYQIILLIRFLHNLKSWIEENISRSLVNGENLFASWLN